MYICRSMKYVYLLLFCPFVYASAYAQDKGTYSKDFAMGNDMLTKKNYSQALRYFSSAYKADSSSANINYKIGRCYTAMDGGKAMAVRYLEKAVTNISATYNPLNSAQVSAPYNAYYYLGVAYHAAYKFGEAINSFKSFRDHVISKDSLGEIDHRIEQCNNARMFILVPNNAKIVNLGDSINSSYSDYNALIASDESSMIFTSDKPAINGPSENGNDHSYIYISYPKNDTGWAFAHMLDKTINGKTENSSSFITLDGQELFITQGDGKSSTIMTSFINSDHWDTPEDPGGDINNPASSTNVCVSPDGSTLYFVSDRPGGFGGKDIWRCVKLPNGKWSLAVNLGSTINTPYNEETPFMHADGKTFFFSSEGHTGIGGYDIFFTQLLDNGKWVEPFNLGYPINTPDNETHFSLSGDSKHGYLNSDRPNSKGGLDIYKVTMPNSGEKPLTVIKGQIMLDNGTALPDEVHIIATDNVTGQSIGDFKPVKSTGSYTIIVPSGKNYTLSYQNGSKEFYNEIIEVPGDAGYKEIRKALTLSPFTWKVTAVDSTNNGEHKDQK
jgi:hypothetical protein